jgi:hypothetical protein
MLIDPETWRIRELIARKGFWPLCQSRSVMTFSIVRFQPSDASIFAIAARRHDHAIAKVEEIRAASNLAK